MSSSEQQQPPPSWTYRMEVSPTGPPAVGAGQPLTDPIALLHLMVTVQTQTLEAVRQLAELQRQQLELVRETTQIGREQRARQFQELERWQQSHGNQLDDAKAALRQLEEVHANLIGELSNYVSENHENLLEGDFALSDFVDRFGPRLAHVNTMLSVLRPLAAAQKKTDSSASGS